MPISEDLRSVTTALTHAAQTQSSDRETLIHVACTNLLALADQIEVLEMVPLQVEAVTPSRRRLRMPHVATDQHLLRYAQ